MGKDGAVASYLETARHQWEEGDRRLRASSSDPDDYETLMAQVEAVTEALRRRIGEHFSLAQLADAYGGDDGWVYEAVAERADRPGVDRQGVRRARCGIPSLRAGRDGLHAMSTAARRPQASQARRRCPRLADSNRRRRHRLRHRRGRGPGARGPPGAVDAGHERPNDSAVDADEPRHGDTHGDGEPVSVEVLTVRRRKCSFA